MTCNWQAGLSISSPYGSPFSYDASGSNTADNVLGSNNDEIYFEYLFTLNIVTCTDQVTCQTYAPASIRVTGEEQYFTLWICDSTTSRISVRNASGHFKVGETITAANGATGTVKEWHNFRESNGLDIIELDNPSGNFPGETVTGSDTSATADCVAGWFDTPGSQIVGGQPVTTEPVIASLSGFYAYPKKVSYTKYLKPKCDTLVDVSGPVGEYGDAEKGVRDSFGTNSNNCEFKSLGQETIDAYKDVWGTTETAVSRESTWPVAANTGIYIKQPILGVDSDGVEIELKNKKNEKLEKQLGKAFDDFFDRILGCDDRRFNSPQDFQQQWEQVTDLVDTKFQRDTIIENTVDVGTAITDLPLEPDVGDQAEMYREMRTYHCQMKNVIDNAIAISEFTSEVMNQSKTIVPSDWFVEQMQKWSTHAFRTVPPAGEKLKWNIFEYIPHSRGTQTFPYTITGTWYCSDIAGTYVGQGSSYTFTVPLVLNSNWDTYRDLLAAAVDAQGNPDGDVKVAQIKEFINPSEVEVKIFDYDAKDFPSFGYLELNNYTYVGRGISEITVRNPGLGYMNMPTVSFSEPDLVGGTLPTAEAIITGGRIYGYKILTEGSGYVQAPIITVSAPDPVLTGTGSLQLGSPYVLNVTFAEIEKIFLGVKVIDDPATMTENEVLRVIPGVPFAATGDGTTSLLVNSILFTEEGFDLDDIQADMIIEGTDDTALRVVAVDMLNNIITTNNAVPVGNYSLNTKLAIQLNNPVDVTVGNANLVFTAPETATATAYTRMYLQAESGSSYEYGGTREIAHYDGVTIAEDGTVTLNNVLRERKQTTAEQHLRDDHTFLHIYV